MDALKRAARLIDALRIGRQTQLGVGPVSKNTVDATIELANEHRIPLMLIASRRQVEAREMGGGYVNGWSTEEFARYVRSRDQGGYVLLARDHGGPWQASHEASMGADAAMASAKRSFEVDIESGFDLIHIDPSIDPSSPTRSPPLETSIARCFELYEFCHRKARACGREILFEVGTDEQVDAFHRSEELERVLSAVTEFCWSKELPLPAFIVAQTGTKVMETRNIGPFDPIVGRKIHGGEVVPFELLKILSICRRYGVHLKEHNADYLSDAALLRHPRLGIHAANVAPEFGVTETRTLLALLEAHGLSELRDRFIELVISSTKWKKWLLPSSRADEREKTVIAGHYVFATPEFAEIRAQASHALARRSIDLDAELKGAVKAAILRYVEAFSLIDTHAWPERKSAS